MRRYAAAILIASSLAMVAQAEARGFFEQAARDIGNGAKAVAQAPAEIAKIVNPPKKEKPTSTIDPNSPGIGPCGANVC